MIAGAESHRPRDLFFMRFPIMVILTVGEKILRQAQLALVYYSPKSKVINWLFPMAAQSLCQIAK
ncbi:hypothetical protein LRP86_00704 [Pseudomonas brassicacearum]|nr:hypothetical protein ASC85_18010 [Pseudomonas sp. Root401]UII13840.1 hypothetical protein LRP86_00704 [Pseudomonas brassicacearum]